MLQFISKTTVEAHPSPELPAERRCHLNQWDLAMLSAHYIQKGLLFANLPPSLSIQAMVEHFKSSLAAALRRFYLLAGRLVTEPTTNGIFIYIDCNNEGAEFIHAEAKQISVADVLAVDADVPLFVRSFFPLDGAVNHDAHSLPLLSVQLTELYDGVFIGCSFNHVAGDGTSYWNFFNAWAEISRSKGDVDAGERPLINERWFIDDTKPPIKLPFSHEDEFIERYSFPEPLREKIFHFSSDSIAKLKAKAIEESSNGRISSFQALGALVWRGITRARRFPEDQIIKCRVACQNRARLRPPQPPDYFGNSIYSLNITAKSGELLANGLGWAAQVIHDGVAGHTGEAIRGMVKKWLAAPVVYPLSMFDNVSVVLGSSPRFNMYGCDFGWGKATAVRSGSANKSDGKVTSYPGWEGGGSVDLEICLVPETMTALESDPEFMAAVSPALPLHLLLNQSTDGGPL